MAQIRDELILVDRFSDPLRNYAAGLQAAARSARSAYEDMAAAQNRGAAAAASSVRQVQYDAANMTASIASSVGGGVNSVKMYAQEIVSIDQQLARMSMDMTIAAQRLAEVARAQGAGSAAAREQRDALAGAVEQSQALMDRQSRLRSVLEEAAGGHRMAAKAIEEQRSSMDGAASSANGLIEKVKGLASAYLGLRGLKELAGLSDSMVQTRARLDMISDGSMSADEIQKMIFESAQRSRGDYMNTADMVSKMGIMAGDSFNGPSEVVAFTEQLNKMYTVSGTNLAGQRAATLQLQQAMAMGVLRGQEFRSVVQQVPMLVQAIGDSLGVSTGEVKKMADEGLITASVVKNAMFSSADEINAKFETMPMTWSQVWTSMKNEAIMAAQPLLDVVSAIAQHWEQLKPVFVGVATAIGIVAVAWGVYTVAQNLANAAMWSNPLFWIVMLIGLVVSAIYQWVQSIGGLKIAWLTTVDAVLTWWDNLKAGFFDGVYWVENLLDNMGLAFLTMNFAAKNALGDLKVGALSLLQGLVNGAIDIVNDFIGVLNNIPGVNIGLVEQVTFAATAAAEHEAAKQARAAEWADAQQEIIDSAAGRDADLARMRLEADNNHRWRQMGIDAERQLAAAAKDDGFDFSGMAQDVGAIAGNTKKISADLADEDLKYLEDVAVRRYETRVNSTSLTPSITVNVKGSADKESVGDITSAIAAILVQQASSHTALSYAEVGV